MRGFKGGKKKKGRVTAQELGREMRMESYLRSAMGDGGWVQEVERFGEGGRRGRIDRSPKGKKKPRYQSGWGALPRIPSKKKKKNGRKGGEKEGEHALFLT